VYLFYGCPIGNFRQPREGRNCSIHNGFDFIVVAQQSADLDNEERSRRVRNAIATDCLRDLEDTGSKCRLDTYTWLGWRHVRCCSG
jgi:hypothetical protein